jgi:hypothetical protein
MVTAGIDGESTVGARQVKGARRKGKVQVAVMGRAKWIAMPCAASDAAYVVCWVVFSWQNGARNVFPRPKKQFFFCAATFYSRCWRCSKTDFYFFIEKG